MPVFYVRSGSFYKSISETTKEEAAKAALETIKYCKPITGSHQLGHVTTVSKHKISGKISLEHTFFRTTDLLQDLLMDPAEYGLEL